MLLRIAESALDRLRSTSYFALRDVRCEYREGELTLLGRLPTHYLKQIAQKVVADLEGVTRVVNQIEVRVPGGRDHVGQSEGPGCRS